MLLVLHALQGHLEAADRHIDYILEQKKFKPTTLEPCLYYVNISDTYMLFLRQVDDSALAVEREQIVHDIIGKLDTQMKVKLKILRRVQMFNGIDIKQTKYYIQLSC